MVRAKKHLGQHFLKNPAIAEKIAQSITVSTPSIVEVGPGTGMLTQFLLNNDTQVFAYEVDSESVEYLEKHFHQKNLHVKEEDFLKANLAEEIPTEFVLTGNFPYNISTEIVFKTIDNRTQIVQMVGMFQKEVAERLCASEGSKTYGITSVITQFYYDTEYLFTVDADEFNPPPKVQSGVMRMTRKVTIPSIDEKRFKQIVKTAFNQRRKKLSNALKPLGIPDHLKNHEYLSLRAEQLSVNNFVELVKFWNG